ncbi:MAG TPA: efflux RND transporter permease subunit [Gemmataceae bacterium]|nr:efflux RND transporter permease subunit [Gemmataceae bacterium]
MWIVRLALRRTYTFVVVALLIGVLGLVSINRMSTDIFPEVNIPVVSVVWQYFGMPADEIETRIILVNERVLTASVNGIEHIESQSLDGVGVIRVYFYPGAKVADGEAQITATCQTLLKVLPPGITPPYIVQYSATSVPIVQIAVSSDTLTEAQLYDYASNFIIQRLGTVQGARVPQPYGGKVRQVMVDLDLPELYARGLSPNDIATTVLNQNPIIPAGTAKIGDTEYDVKLNNSPDLVNTFNFMPVKTVNGVPIYLKDVAHVRDGFAVQTNIVRRDGRRAVLMTILKAEGASTIDIVRRLREAMPGVQAQLPPDIKLEFLFDQSVFVENAVQGVLKEGAIAAGLTALMILLFLGSWRSTLIVAVSIPLSILTSIIVLWAMGQSLNIMTLGGMALAVGILVDDATVELENTHRNMGAPLTLPSPPSVGGEGRVRGKTMREAILDSAAQVATPALVSTLCICIVFLPVVFLTGPAASLFIPLALAVVFAMLASYFLSRTLVPTMMLYLLPKEMHLYQGGDTSPQPKQGSRFNALAFPFVWLSNTIWRVHHAFDRAFERLRSAYTGLLGRAIDRPWLTAGAMLGFALASLALFPTIGQDFFPAVDAGQFRLHVRAPAGTRIEETEALFGRVEDVIRQVVPDQERSMILDNMGLTQSFTIMAYLDNGTVSDSDGEILVSLKPNHKPTEDYVARLRRELPNRFPGCTFYFMPADITSQILDFGLPAPIDVQVVGVDAKDNLALAKKLQAGIAKLPGLTDVHIHQITDRRDLRVDVDRIEASQLGLTENDVANNLLVSLSSTYQVSPNYWVNPQNRVNYRVAVQTPDWHMNSVAALESTPIIVNIGAAGATNAGGTAMVNTPNLPTTGQPQLLSNLINLRRTTSEQVVNHYNVQRVYDIYAGVQGRDLGGASADVQKVVDSLKAELPRGSTINVRGQVQSMNSSFLGLAGGLVFAVLLVYFLMVVNFQSWLDPFIILTALPGALAGIVWILFATHTTISVPALMGAMMCVGVATSNSILMVTFANDERRAGKDARAAALSAGTTRLRPVLMTALAMIVGMLPMSLGLGDGGEENAPLGRAVIGGLLVATLFTLVFVPVMYRLLRRKAPRPEQDGDDAASDRGEPAGEGKGGVTPPLQASRSPEEIMLQGGQS